MHRDGDASVIIDVNVVNAAARILGGDDSAAAAAELERAIHSYLPYEDALDDLLEALALYAPTRGAPYLNYEQLCAAIRQFDALGQSGPVNERSWNDS